MTKYDIDFGGLGRLLRSMDAKPIRRHRCDVCREVFECHLCTMEEDHMLHGGGSREGNGNGRRANTLQPVFCCLPCIDQHELAVVVISAARNHTSRLYQSRWTKFYDPKTGERIR